ncbi:uncharacterized protein PHACADRAFT_210857, partial [Phanerochaete carnosa HHB-10118-sp]
MLSFKSLATVATLAFGALSVLAAPTLQARGVDVAADASLHLVRDTQVAGVAQIIQTTITTLTPMVEQFKFITASNCTADTLTPMVTSVKT